MWTYDNSYNELYHYGVKGMKWGVRRTKEQLGYGVKTGEYQLQNYTTRFREELKDIPKLAVSAVATALIPGYAYLDLARTTNNVYKHALDTKDYIKQDGELEKVSQMRKQTVKTTVDEDVKLVNPRIGKQAGKINNCMNCTAAMEMRARGYDVQARRSGRGKVETTWKEWFPDAKVVKHTAVEKQKGESQKAYINRNYNSFCNTLEKLGNGARGYAGNTWKGGGGHAIFFKVDNGRVKFYDGQNPKDKVDHIFALADQNGFSYVRLDKSKVSDNVGKAVISRKEKGK